MRFVRVAASDGCDQLHRMKVSCPPEDVRAAFASLQDPAGFEESVAAMAAGHLPLEMLQAFSLRPEILQAFAAFNRGTYPDGLLERPLKEKVILWSSRQNSCQFCAGLHTDVALAVGVPPEGVHDLTADLTPREAAALAYEEAVFTDSNRVPEAVFAELKAQFTDPEIVELTALIGWINALNWFNNALGVRYHGEARAENP